MPHKAKNHEPQKPVGGINTVGFTARVNRQRKRNLLAKQSKRVNR